MSDKIKRYRKYIDIKCSICCIDLRVRTDQIKGHTEKCVKCSHRKRPFESVYNRLLSDWRKIEMNLSYEEFIEFTKQPNCHYCGQLIPWEPYATVDGKFISSAYFLDRKNNDGPYSQENCVVCCTSCNHIRGNHFRYEEFVKVGKILAERYSGS